MALTIKHRCIACRKVLREDGTCQNPDCFRYKPPKTDDTTDTTTEETTTTNEEQ